MVDKSEKFSWLVRLGYGARGLLYLVIGYLALSSSGHDKSQRGAMDYVRDELPGGQLLLYVAAAGLLGYALYKFCSLLFDVEHHGGRPKGIAVRIAHGGGGIIYTALAWSALQLAQGQSQDGANGGVKEATGTLLTYSFGVLVLGLVGLGFFVAAGAQLRQAITAHFMKHISGRAPHAIENLGRAGHAARAVVFAIVGWSLVHFAWMHDGQPVESLGDAVDQMAGEGLLYTILGIGLLMFGLFSLLVGRYRIIPDLDRSDLKPRLH